MQKSRIAHRDVVSGIAVCERVESHTVTWWNIRDDLVERSG